MWAELEPLMIRPRRYLSLPALALTLVLGALVVTGAPAGATTTTLVRPGDTLWQIAADHDVAMNDLAAANGMDPNDVLLAGTRLTIPRPPSSLRGRMGRSTSAAATPQPAAAEVGSAQPAHGPGATTGARLAQQRQFCSQTTGPDSANLGQLPDQLRGSSRIALRPRFIYWSRTYGVPAELLQAVAWQESGWQNRVVSSSGAVGVGQLMPDTVAYVSGQLLGVKLNPKVPDDNIRMSARFLQQLLASSGGNLCEAIASYYEGPDLVQRAGVLKETQPYVRNVLALMPRFVAGSSAGRKKSSRP